MKDKLITILALIVGLVINITAIYCGFKFGEWIKRKWITKDESSNIRKS